MHLLKYSTLLMIIIVELGAEIVLYEHTQNRAPAVIFKINPWKYTEIECMTNLCYNYIMDIIATRDNHTPSRVSFSRHECACKLISHPPHLTGFTDEYQAISTYSMSCTQYRSCAIWTSPLIHDHSQYWLQYVICLNTYHMAGSFCGVLANFH